MRFNQLVRCAFALALLLSGSGWLSIAEAQDKKTSADRPVLSTVDGSVEVFADQLQALAKAPAPTSAAAQRGAPTLPVDGATSNGNYDSGDPNNTTMLLPIGAGNALTGIGWEVNIEAFAPSFLSEAIVVFVPEAGAPNGLFLTIGNNDDTAGSRDYSSDGTILLADAEIPDVPAGPDGNLYIEWYESFDDESVNPDASWSNVAVGQTLPPGLRLLCTDQLACDAAVSGGATPPPPPSGLRVDSEDGELSLAWVAVSAPDLVGYHVYRATTPFSEPGDAMRLTSAPEEDTDYDDTSAVEGTTYFYRVSAVDTDGNESALSNQVSAVLRPTAVNASVNLSFGDAEQQQNYRLVALPGEVSLSLASTVTGSSPDDWRAFREAGSGGGEDFSRNECGAGASCRLTPGAGYWLLAENPWEVNDTFPTVALASGGTYAIPVHSGWNAISNPLEVNVPWQRVVEVNGLAQNQELYNWNGTWQTAATFGSASSGRAFYFLNTDASRTSLDIPFPPAGARQSEVASSRAQSGTVFELSLTTFLEGAATASATVAITENAVEGLDDFDRFAPPGYFEAAGIALVNDAVPAPYRRLRHDARSVGADGYTFDVEVTAESGAEVEVVPNLIAESEAYEAVLIDPASGVQHAVVPGAALHLRSGSPSTRYTLRVGPTAFIDAGRSVPQDFEVGSYPNPFASAVTVRYGMPEQGRVRLAVYDLLGKRVATLVENEEREAGYHAAVWAPRGLASGVYFYVLETGARRLTGKLSLVR